jgi:hypothetical protein
MLLITTKGVSHDSLNQVHDIWCIPTTLERTLRYGLDLLSYEVKYTKVKSMGLLSHSHKDVPFVGWNVGAISFPMSHCLPKKIVQVSIEGKKIRSGPCAPSFVVWIHKLELAYIKVQCYVNLVAVCISSPKTKKPNKVLIGDLILPSLCHPGKFPCITPLLNIQDGKELSNYLIVPILSKSHNISQVFGFTCNHNLIKDPIVLSLHVIPFNLLGNCHRLVLGDYYRLIKVLLECSVRHVVNLNLLLNKPQIFLPFLSHQIRLSFVVDFLPPIQILRLPNDWSPHV